MYIFDFKKIYFTFYFVYEYLCVCVCMPESACGGHRKQLNNLELELKVVTVYPIQVMETEHSPLQKQEMHVTMELSL